MAPGQKVDLGNLPSSTDYYEKFGMADEKECNTIGDKYDKLRKELESKLEEYDGLQNQEGPITKAYCYACKKKGEYVSKEEQPKPDADTPCRFFYHWIEKYVLQYASESSVSAVVEAIYETLGSSFNENKCNVKYSDVDKNRDIFNSRKRVFDFSYDYKAVKKYLEQGDPKCKGEWPSYHAEVTNACDAAKEYCEGTGSSDPYCTGPYQKYKSICDSSKLSSLQCTERPTETVQVDAPPDPQSESTTDLETTGLEGPHDQSPQESVVAVEPPMKTQVMGPPGPHTVSTMTGDGLTQHYTSFFPNIHNFFGSNRNRGSNRRGKRSIRRELNRFPDDDDSSTEYATTISITGDSTTLYSVPYIR